MKIKDIKNKLEKGKKPTMAILYPASPNQKALKDFKNPRFFGSVKDCFNIKLVKCPIANKECLIEATHYRNVRNADILVIIRGGGEGLEVFNDKEVVRAFAILRQECGTVICVGIGHSADRPAIYDIASLGATTPTELSVFFKDLVSKDWEEVYETWSKCAQNPEDIQKKIRELLNDKVERIKENEDIHFNEEELMMKLRQQYFSASSAPYDSDFDLFDFSKYRKFFVILGIELIISILIGIVVYNDPVNFGKHTLVQTVILCKNIFVGLVIFTIIWNFLCMLSDRYAERRERMKKLDQVAKWNWEYYNQKNNNFWNDDDDLYHDPAYRHLACNIHHNHHYFD
jgi:hypothetical protein